MYPVMWVHLAISLVCLIYLIYLALKVTAIFSLVGLVVVIWAVVGWKIWNLKKKRS